MNAQGFLQKELSKIDISVTKKITSFIYEDFSLNELLPYAATEEVFFFESKDEDYTFLGLGMARELPFSSADQFALHNPEEVLVLKKEFESNSKTLCYLPEWSFIRQNKQVKLIVHHSQEYKSYSPSNIIFNPTVWESFVGPWMSFDESPDSDEWKKMIQESSRLFRKKDLMKIVLSRKKIFTYDTPIDMLVMFREVYEANLSSSHYSIYQQSNYLESFISLTPERLFTLKGLNLETISLAGSTPRGANPEEDSKLEVELKNSEKLIREHEFVTKSISDRLNPLMKNLEISPLMTMKLPYIQHRQAKITGVLKESTTIETLVSLLHPTPAVGGIPYELSQEKILEIEKGVRSQYAAPIGIISLNLTEIVVGIRSAMIQGESITVFGGAGIVEGSEALEEWDETGAKMQPFIKVINKSVLQG